MLRLLLRGFEVSQWAVLWALGAEVDDAAARCVLVGLAAAADERDEAVVSIATLARIANAMKFEVWHVLDDLELRGLIQVQRPQGMSCESRHFRLLIPRVFNASLLRVGVGEPHDYC